MKLSISNIGWAGEFDTQMYALMRRYGFSGLEIAPTRVFGENPYDKIRDAADWSKNLNEKYGLRVSSMQSIWYGRTEKLFDGAEDRRILIDYTKKAIDFAAATGCGNLVFGCPRNRYLPEGANPADAEAFFGELGSYAAEKGTVLAMEANPPIYNTNYINTTKDALELIKEVGSEGFLLNLDVGTMVENRESVSELEGQVFRINHVHISEPGLKQIVKRELHRDLFRLLKKEDYHGWISIELGRQENLDIIEEALKYVSELWGEEYDV